ncbi:hypothetical protein Tco_0193243, partial [Tanacetum coccineum]
PSLDYTPVSPDYPPASYSESDPSEDPSLDHIHLSLRLLLLPRDHLSYLAGTHDDYEEEGWTVTCSATYYSSLEASSDFHSDASFDSSSRHSFPDHSSPNLSSTSAGPSHKRHRSPTTYVPALPPVFGALSPVRADLIPSPTRVRDSQIDECFAYADAFRDMGIDARVVV